MDTFRGYKATDKPRCPNGKFIDAENPECECHGSLEICHCGEYKPIVSIMKTSYRLRCDCSGASTGCTTVPA